VPNIFIFLGHFLVGIEILSYQIRRITLGLRMFANITGGHILCRKNNKRPRLHYEIFVRRVQTLIFTLLRINYFEESKHNL
jgi:F0F1-type ATP synthase membrane subunit a